MKIKKTVKEQIYRLLISVLLFCMVIVMFSVATTHDLMNNSRTFVESNNALSHFYYTVNEMDIAAREWLYSGKDEDYENYQSFSQEAKEDLVQICGIGDQAITKRIERLNNMVEYYDTTLQRYISEENPVYDTYFNMQYQGKLIRNTSTAYYGYLAEYLENNAEKIQTQWDIRFWIQIIFLMGLTIAAVVVSGSVSRSILGPVKIMIENSHRIQQGNFALEPVTDAPEEIAVMAAAFSEMAEHVEENIDILTKNAKLEQKLLQQESEQLVMQNLVTQAELHSLQAQINPHFLFNTLSMISQSAYLSQDTTTSELIDRLAGFLRYALDKSNTTSTLLEEVQSIEDYFFIQKKRFGDRLDFVIDVADNVPNVQMPAIILQPLIENSIKHGMGLTTENIVISLKVRFREGRIRILIEDDGDGMSAEQLENLQSCLRLGLESSCGKPGTSIGITNVYRRLKIYFGTQMQFNIESEETCGTLITISLPMEKEP